MARRVLRIASVPCGGRIVRWVSLLVLGAALQGSPSFAGDLLVEQTPVTWFHLEPHPACGAWDFTDPNDFAFEETFECPVGPGGSVITVSSGNLESLFDPLHYQVHLVEDANEPAPGHHYGPGFTTFSTYFNAGRAYVFVLCTPHDVSLNGSVHANAESPTTRSPESFVHLNRFPNNAPEEFIAGAYQTEQNPLPSPFSYSGTLMPGRYRLYWSMGAGNLQDEPGGDFAVGFDFTAQPNTGDLDADGVSSPGDKCPTVFDPDQLDGDADGVGDECDNCPRVANARFGAFPLAFQSMTGCQLDDDGDGFGNACDADYDSAGAAVNGTDLALFKAAFGKKRAWSTCNPGGAVSCDRYDHNNVSAAIDTSDFTIFKTLFGKTKKTDGDIMEKCSTCPLICVGDAC